MRMCALAWIAIGGAALSSAPLLAEPVPPSPETRPAAGNPSAPVLPSVEGTAQKRADPKTLLQDPAFREKLRRWQTMSEADRARLTSSYEQFKTLPNWQRENLMTHWAQFRSLPSDEQAAAKMWYGKLPSDGRASLQQCARRVQDFTRTNPLPLGLFTRWLREIRPDVVVHVRQLPPEERADVLRPVVRQYHEYLATTIESQLPESERETYKQLTLDEKVARVRKWISDRKDLQPDRRPPHPWWERPGRRPPEPTRGPRVEPGAHGGWRHRPGAPAAPGKNTPEKPEQDGVTPPQSK
jgi:hypothetical protein